MSKIRDHQSTQPVIRFKGFTDAWEKRKLGNLAEIVRGASPRPIQDPKWFDSSSEIGWLRIADVTEQNGRIHHLEQHISKAGQEKTRVLTQPHLLLSIAATVGKPLINYVSTGVHDGFLIFLKPKFELEFMYQWLEYFRPYWQKYGQPGSQVNLNSELVRNQSLHLPVVEEQIKIGHFLDKLNNLIAVNQRKGDVLQNLKKGLLQRLFASETSPIPDIRFKGFTDAWEKRKLGEVATITMGQSPDSKNYTLNPQDHILVQGNADIKNGWVEPRVWTTQITKIAKKGSVLLSVRAPVGEVSKTAFDVVLGRGVASVGQTDFLYQYLITLKINGFWLRYSTGSTFDSINSADIKDAIIFLPEKNEQSRIAKTLNCIDNLIAATQCKLDLLKKLKKGYLQKMFC